MTQTRTRLIVGAGLSTLAICAVAGGAGAAGLIGSRDIANDSIRSIDIKDGALTGRDVKNGSLHADDFSTPLPAGVPGPTGPTGPPGPPGASGSPGPQGSDSIGPAIVYTWSGSYVADGSTGGSGPLVTSNTAIPPNSLVRGLDISVTGDEDHTACSAGLIVGATIDHASFGTFVAVDDDHVNLDGPRARHEVTDQVITSPSTSSAMAIGAQCAGGGGNGAPVESDLPVPGFDFTVTFSVTPLAAPPTATMN